MNLGEIRQIVRDQVDQDDTDLPNSRLDGYIREGYERMIQLETRWPFFEKQWQQAVTATSPSFVMPSDVSEILAVVYPSTGTPSSTVRLRFIEHRDGEDLYGVTPLNGDSLYWSRIANTVYLWPPPQTTTTFILRGYRKPTDWMADGETAVVDADDRLHWPIVNYALSLVYAQQEDEVLEADYMQRFREGVSLARAAVMRPWREETLILGGRVSPRRRFNGDNLAFISTDDVDGGSP